MLFIGRPVLCYQKQSGIYLLWLMCKHSNKYACGNHTSYYNYSGYHFSHGVIVAVTCI